MWSHDKYTVKFIQSRLTKLYLELAYNIYTDPVDERLMGELNFNFTMTLPLWRIRKGRESHLHETARKGSRDIREMFSGVNKKRKEQGNCITIE